VYGDGENVLQQTSAVYNIGCDKLLNAIKYFQECSSNTSDHRQLIQEYSEYIKTVY
jgi:hypothetical protein